MCRWLSYCGRPLYLESLLFEPENSLIQQSLRARHAAVTTNGDGFGVGWYAGRDVPGIYREVLPAWNDGNLRSLAHQIRASLFFAHVRASTGTATSRANCHPFSHGNWLFMHNGQIGGYEQVRRRLESLIPDELYAARQGTTDSELIFFLLFRYGLERDPPGALRKAIQAVVYAMAEAGIEQPFRMTAALSSGRSITALRYSTDDHPPSLYWSEHDGDLTVVSEPLDATADQWNEVPTSHLLTVTPSGTIDLQRFAL
ncbi:MAG: class II glutamine amidotransferase [Pseudomonadota bacterium]